MTPVAMAPSARIRRPEDGFSLVELMIVLLVIAVLMVIGIVSYFQMTRQANDRAAQLDLLTAVKVQTLHHLDNDVFTDDRAVLLDLEPMLRYTDDGVPVGTVVVKSETGREATDVCLFTQTEQGDWFSIYHSVETGDLYAESSPIDCTPGDVAAWSNESW